MNDNWDRRFVALAKFVASWSKDPSTKCGAVIVRPDKTIASVGFNGFPKWCSDNEDFYQNKELKYGRIIHAEINAILHAKESLEQYTMYTWPGGIGPSCDRCTGVIIQSGITRVVHELDTSDFVMRWKDSVERGLNMYEEAGVQIIVLR